jgi:2-alkyl-3-oxoalkanoate reductase
MRIFVAGASGAVGIRVVRLLVAAGNFVVGTTRSNEKVGMIRAAGAQAAVVDGLDAQAVRRAVAAATPEVIIHEMTALGGGELKHFERTFAVTNRLRTEGLHHLLTAAKQLGVRRLIAQSYCGWPYARNGAAVKTEDNELDPDPPRELKPSLDAIRYLESTLLGAADLEGIVLRYGSFYGPGTGVLESTVLRQVRHRQFPVIGNGNGWWSFVHVDDAAAATARATDHGGRGVYNVVDDEPAPGTRVVAGACRACGRQAAVAYSQVVRSCPRGRSYDQADDRGSRGVQCEGQRRVWMAAAACLLARGFRQLDLRCCHAQ